MLSHVRVAIERLCRECNYRKISPHTAIAVRMRYAGKIGNVYLRECEKVVVDAEDA